VSFRTPDGTTVATGRRPGPRPATAGGHGAVVDSPEQRGPRTDLPLLVGLAAVAFSLVYFLSDLLELAQEDFSTTRLTLTNIGEAAIPLFVIGLYAVQAPHIGRLGLIGAALYAYIFFTGTVVYALIAKTPNYAALTTVFGTWMAVHGAIMLVGGCVFGLAVARSGTLPRWTGICLITGVVLVVAASGLPTAARTIAEAFPAAAFIGMGAALLGRGRRAGRRPATPTPGAA
jgi:hypothetical protein